MNIWCVSKYASLPSYGAGARLFYLAREFKKRGHEALLITSDANHLANFPETANRYNYENIDNLEVIWIKTKKYAKTASISRVLSWLDFELGLFFLKRNRLPKPDVILVSSLSIFSIVYGWVLKKRYKSKLVFEIRDIWPLTMLEEGGFSPWNPLVLLIGLLEKFGYKVADLIVGTMPRLDLHVEKVLGYPRSVFCSPLGFDEEAFQVSTDSKKNFVDSFPKNKIIVGYAGSMGVSNALDPFISCIEELNGNDDLHFMLIGGGDLRKQYEDRLSKNKNVTFLPKIHSKEVPLFLEHCDILYLSTHDSEIWKYGQSMNKFVEYMLSGRPIIASYSGYQSMLNDAGAGQFVPSNDSDQLKQAILTFSAMDYEERRVMGLKGKKWISANRSYTKLAEQYLAELASILDNHTLTVS